MNMKDNDIGDLSDLMNIQDLTNEQEQQLKDAESVERSPVKNADSIKKEFENRWADVEAMARQNSRKVDDIEQCLAAAKEFKESDVKKTYIDEDREAREAVENLLQTIEYYQDLVGNFVPMTYTMYYTGLQMDDVLDEQQLRHDESFVLKNVSQMVKDNKRTFEDNTMSMKQTFESSMESALQQVVRLVDPLEDQADTMSLIAKNQALTADSLIELNDRMDSMSSKRVLEELQEIKDKLDEAVPDEAEED